MNMPKIFAIAVIGAGLSFGVAAHGAEKEKEETINSSDVPAAVQQAAEKHAKNGKIVRWEKEGGNYEAVIEKKGKEWGFAFDSTGKLVSKHEEAQEHSESGEKH